MGTEKPLREKFSTTMDPELIKKLKLAAIDRGLKLNEIFEIAVESYLKSLRIKDKK